jgi:UDP-N-acetylglucosamine 2-epimerase (non-hydrolysing)
MEQVRFEEYALATAHRMENVDDSIVLNNFVEVFCDSPIPIVFSVHPRTRKRLHQFGIWKKIMSSDNVQLLPPLGYFDFLLLMKNCRMILTDSGGLQEESTAPSLRKPVLVLRLSTERPEAVDAGFARVVGVQKHDILAVIEEILKGKLNLSRKSPFGDGHAGERIVQIIMEELI